MLLMFLTSKKPPPYSLASKISHCLTAIGHCIQLRPVSQRKKGFKNDNDSFIVLFGHQKCPKIRAHNEVTIEAHKAVTLHLWSLVLRPHAQVRQMFDFSLFEVTNV